MSWVKERLEELGFEDVAASLPSMTKQSRKPPRKYTEAQKQKMRIQVALLREKSRPTAGMRA